jgi:hypothetical protein
MNKEELFNKYLKECENICSEYHLAINKIKNNNNIRDIFKLEEKELKKELKENLNYLYNLNSKLKSYESLFKNI